MKSYTETRVRVVEMDKIARAALDISSYRITTYEGPKTVIHRIVPPLFILCLLTAVFHSHIIPGTYIYDTVLQYYPGGPEWFKYIGKMAAVPALVTHVGESWYFDRSRLRKYGVERGTGLWWMWMGSCMLEGFACFQRVDWQIDAKKKAAESAKH